MTKIQVGGDWQVIIIRWSLNLLFLFALLLPAAMCFATAPDESLLETEKVNSIRSDAFYDSLSAVSDRNWILKSVHSMVISPDSSGKTLPIKDPPYEYWQDRVIRTIWIRNFEVFETDSTKVKGPLIRTVAKLGNAIHLNTRSWTTRGNLFFRAGDTIEPITMRRNLIYLRNLVYLKEAHVLVLSSNTEPDSADVYIMLQDKFSINLGGQFKSLSEFNFRLEDVNFLGLGHQLHNTWHIDPDHKGAVGWESKYSIPNLHGTFIQGDLSWTDLPGLTKKGVAFNRPFLFPAKNLAGGIDLAESYVRPPSDSIAVDKVLSGGWLGYSVRGYPGPANQYAYAAMSVENTWFKKRPEVGPLTGGLWHENLLALASIGLTQTDYGYLPHVYSFLENENIPVGYLAEFLLGHAYGEFRGRDFMGLHGSWAKVYPNGQFLYLEGGIESFLAKGKLEQGLIVLEPMLITPLRLYGKIRDRTFLKARVILGIERFPTETLHLATDLYLRGNRDLTGKNLISVTAEKDLIMPWDILGFKIVFFCFIEGAMVTEKLLSPTSDNLLFTEGLGFRLRNTHLIWKSIEMHVALNQTKGDFKAFNFVLTAKLPLKLLDFEGRRPKIYTFE